MTKMTEGDALMADNYEKGMYNQLMEVMARLDAVESSLSTEKAEYKDDVKRLNARINDLTQKTSFYGMITPA